MHQATLTLRSTSTPDDNNDSNASTKRHVVLLLSGPSPALERAQTRLEGAQGADVEVVLLGQDPVLASGVKLLEEVLVLGNVALSA